MNLQDKLLDLLESMSELYNTPRSPKAIALMVKVLEQSIGYDRAIAAAMQWSLKGKGFPTIEDLVTLGKPKTGISLHAAVDEARDAIVAWLEGRNHKGSPIAMIAWNDLGGRDLRQQPVLDDNQMVKEAMQRRIFGACRAAAERVECGREENDEARKYLGLETTAPSQGNLLSAAQ